MPLSERPPILLHRKDYPGKPDIVLPKYHASIFVHGCFWHRYRCKLSTFPVTHKEFWEAKFAANVTQARQNREALRNAG